MLEFDGPVRPANLGHEGRAMARFHVRCSTKIGCEHGEVVGDNRIEFVILPMRTNLRFVSHGQSPSRLATRPRSWERPIPAISLTSSEDMSQALTVSAMSKEVL